MAGNSWQQPVAGEPSAGTFHPKYALIMNNVDPADTNWHEVDISASVPVGTKAIFVTGQFTTTVATNYQMSNANGGSSYIVNVAATNGYGGVCGIVPVSSTRTVWYKVGNAGVSGIYTYMSGYFI